MADDFYSFNEALDQLRLKEEELKRLVSEGEIRAFRDGDNMKLRRQDVENLRAELSGGEVVDLGDSTEELVFEDDGFEDPMMATQEVETVIEDVGDDEMLIEDIGEDEDDDFAAPLRRKSPAVAAIVEEETEDGLTRFALIAASLVLLASVPVVLSLAKGDGAPSDMAKTVGGIFSAGLAK